ncbi:helix-turn-helix transcriptional regulator [Elizabethkingia meningoseptica]|uniref:helix-turn-helix transcriptional regulator n=1 Tax=Elizabethkingia meningoseptica TaxID=238 RepID=UPI000AFA62DF|nr:helix-turn-helix transcriptional regulator [Elizabethkingia meningoseptica]MCL1674124.1 helix-turn-helix domain-containing protein [Elizabethkingia meningoseptica]MCL1685235.1 helix-turn-helix domain-containing protein [Elizabethkingia meningoseptica]MEC4711277.1 helix-turn-helix transcriptional regulator [Elizabethkingia meningoseptica]WBS73630.1 helix-turn-helix transcriptional regulator [Elizabethkingia meningoseptica]SQG07438.1 Helix-turn-helix [Elizabethkingia meningoseptica]
MMKNKLIQIRKDKQFSQQDIAEYLKISQTQYQRKEKGFVEVKDEEWQRLARLFEVGIEVIWEENNLFENQENIHDYCSIPGFLLDNQQEYIEMLKVEISQLKQRLSEYEGGETGND